MNISVRVVWHDDGWGYRDGCKICNDDKACRADSGLFMSDKPITIDVKHPYKKKTGLFKDLEDVTTIKVSPYSLIGRIFGWTLKENVEEKAELYPLNYNEELEDELVRGLGYATSWTTHGKNQAAIFKYFYEQVEPDKSLVFPYSKRCSLTDSAGRIILGVGHVKKVGKSLAYDGESEIEPLIWERPIEHSIREEMDDGFLLPFDELKEFLKQHPEEDPDDYLVVSPPEYFLDYSYATDKVSLDATIWTLTQLLKVVRRYIARNIGGGDWEKCVEWLQEEIDKAWAEKPDYPGLGALLQASGFRYGEDLAKIAERNSDGNIWDSLEKIIDNPKEYVEVGTISESVLSEITGMRRDLWKKKISKSPDYLKLLARFDLSYKQMKYFVENAEQESEEVIDNPYRLYEKSRDWVDEGAKGAKRVKIRLQQIDYTLFPKGECTDFSKVKEKDDKRRIRALMVYYLEEAAENGNTLLSRRTILDRIKDYQEELDLSGFKNELFEVYEEFFGEEIIQKMGKYTDEKQSTTNETFVKLKRIQNFDNVIRKFVDEHLKGELRVKCDWLELIKRENVGKELDADDLEAMKDTAKVMERLASHRLSILTGGAGSGKTTAIAAFCGCKEISKDGILLLAPTGKARMVLGQKVKGENVSAQTVAQFLLSKGCWNPYTGAFNLLRREGGTSGNVEYDTVIIDECSMLTTEMMGALFDVLLSVKRVILIGDPNQLPPIGPGKPFYDLVKYFKSKHVDCYNRLTYNWRQKDGSGKRLDADLARLFTDEGGKVDDIFDKIGSDTANVEFVKYEDESDFNEKMLEIMVKCTGMRGADDFKTFDESIGGIVSKDGKWMNFICSEKVESWQIITPFRNKEVFGAAEINKVIHEKYRPDDSSMQNRRRTYRMLGDEKIMYGDKVINVRNQRRKAWPEYLAQNYIANGEIGLVVGLRGKYLNVGFSSQKGYMYSFLPSSNTENACDLELGYALTVHKSQGSTYKDTILALNVNPDRVADARFITREMIYTALTRQSNKIYILYNAEPYTLQKLAYNSNIAERLTDLFEELLVVRFQNRDWDKNLIHITRSGIKVRSKSEVAIADLLYDYRDKLDFDYEKQLKLGDKVRVPDFTIKLMDGRTIYWEHLGMLNVNSYRLAWERKKKLYKENGISEEDGNLITTRDNSDGSLDMQKIEQMVKGLVEQ